MIKSLTIKQIITINKRINIFSFTKVFIITYDIINTLKLRIFFLLKIEIVNPLLMWFWRYLYYENHVKKISFKDLRGFYTLTTLF
jgi:hypothetical protein